MISAAPAGGELVAELLQPGRLSAPYGTVIEVDGDVGRLRLG